MASVVLGRSPSRTSEVGTRASSLFGRDIDTGDAIYLDLAKPHVVLVTGKRGSGKSYTQSNIIEGIALQPNEIRDNIAVIVLDTIGIFWSLKYPNTNTKEVALLHEYSLEAKGVGADIYVPQRLKDKYKMKDNTFTIAPGDITPEGWCLTFEIDQNSPMGIAITRAVSGLRKDGTPYGLDDIIDAINGDQRVATATKEAIENRLQAAKSWGIFSNQGIYIDKLIEGGRISIIDLSELHYSADTWNVRSLVVSLIAERVLTSLMERRKLQQMKAVSDAAGSTKEKCPQVWIVIDEAHQFLPSGSTTPASWPLKRIVREGRQPGVSLVLATQQPGKLDSDVITQCDIAITHHITSKLDIDGLNKIMNTYQKDTIQASLSLLPKKPGSALVIDDTRETIQSMRVRPKMTLHAGDSPDILADLMNIL